jgi:hypothetical protein
LSSSLRPEQRFDFDFDFLAKLIPQGAPLAQNNSPALAI